MSNEKSPAKHGEVIQSAILEIMNHGRILFIPTNTEHFADTHIMLHENLSGSIYLHQSHFLKGAGVQINSLEFEGKDRRVHVNKAIFNLIQELLKLKLIELEKYAKHAEIHPEPGEFIQVDTNSYMMTGKGLDTALKIQEHRDNQRRFDQQKGISETIKDNSTKSLWTARGGFFLSIVVACFAIWRIDIAEDQLQNSLIHSQEQLKIAKEQLFIAQQRLNILKAEKVSADTASKTKPGDNSTLANKVDKFINPGESHKQPTSGN